MLDHAVTGKQLAAILGLTERRISELTRTGTLTRPYRLAEAVQAYIAFLKAGRGSLTEERTRLVALKADLAQLDKQHRNAELVRVEVVAEQWATVATAIRSKLLGLPSKLSPQLIGMRTPAAVAARLKTAIEEALTELSRLSAKDVERLAKQERTRKD